MNWNCRLMRCLLCGLVYVVACVHPDYPHVLLRHGTLLSLAVEVLELDGEELAHYGLALVEPLLDLAQVVDDMREARAGGRVLDGERGRVIHLLLLLAVRAHAALLAVRARPRLLGQEGAKHVLAETVRQAVKAVRHRAGRLLAALEAAVAHAGTLLTVVARAGCEEGADTASTGGSVCPQRT